MAAYDAVLPAGCQRTIYLCDDGKDPKKRKFCEGIGSEVRALLNPTSNLLSPCSAGSARASASKCIHCMFHG